MLRRNADQNTAMPISQAKSASMARTLRIRTLFEIAAKASLRVKVLEIQVRRHRNNEPTWGTSGSPRTTRSRRLGRWPTHHS